MTDGYASLVRRRPAQQNSETSERTRTLDQMSRQIGWGRVLVEGVVIVGSILLAFGIDAGWAERSERRTEREELQRVFDELTLERDRILGFEAAWTGRAAAALDFVDRVRATDNPPGTIAVPDSVLETFFNSLVFRPLTPALDGLLDSGNYAVIRDAGVRAAIASLQREFEYLDGVQSGAADFMREQLLPAFVGRGDMTHVLLHSRGRRQELGDGVTEVRVDTDISALVSYRHIQSVGVASGLGRARAAADAVLAAIDATRTG